jgi:hypothetical protein
MRGLLAFALLILTPPVLSDLDRAQAEKHQVQIQLLSCQAQLVEAQLAAQKAALTEQQAKLEQRFREILKPAEGDVFDWVSLTWRPAGKP